MNNEQLDKIKWLNRAFESNQKINALLAEYETAKTLACKCTVNYENDGTMHTAGGNGTESRFIKVCEASERINEMIDSLVGVREEISDAIATIHDDELEAVLIHHFLAYKTWEQTAECMGYDVRTIRRKKIKAIDKLSANVLECPVQKMI